jgi:NADH:quinone reductase (non-electrogenic)
VRADGVCLADGSFIASELVVWSAGVKAPDFLKNLDGLQVDRLNQLIVAASLQTTACPRLGSEILVPPRAQVYRDFGSLVSLGEYSTVGSLMGSIVGKSLFIEDYFARLMYRSLYKMHELALHGSRKTLVGTFARGLSQRAEPEVKLH